MRVVQRGMVLMSLVQMGSLLMRVVQMGPGRSPGVSWEVSFRGVEVLSGVFLHPIYLRARA